MAAVSIILTDADAQTAEASLYGMADQVLYDDGEWDYLMGVFGNV